GRAPGRGGRRGGARRVVETARGRRPPAPSSRRPPPVLAAAELVYARLPVLAVERPPRERHEVDVVEAARVDVDRVRVRARHVEARHAAVTAETVLRDPRVEAIGGEVGLTREQSEGSARHDPVPVSLAGADRAVALAHLARTALNLVAHAAAVAAARRDHRHRGMLETATGGVNAC